MKTPYDVLGVRRSADANAIRTALRRAAKTYHPDLNAGDPEAEQHLREALAAYELLMSPDQRAAYDQQLRLRRQGKARRFLATALATAAVASGATLSLAVWLAQSPQQPQQEASVAAPGLHVAAVEPADRAGPTAAPFEYNAPTQGVSEEAADHAADRGPPATQASSSLAREWEQVALNGDPMAVWGFVHRNPEAVEAELARSWMMLLIDASEDVHVLNALRDANGAVADRAQLRLDHLSAAAIVRGRASAAAAANDAGPIEAPIALDAASYLQRGLRRFRNANFDGAIADFDAVIGLEPRNALAHRHRANAWCGKGYWHRALADLELAILIDPGNPAIFRDRGILFRRNGALDLALLDFDQAIRLGFSDARAYNERGLVWHEKGSYERAIADFTQAIKIDANLVDAYINRSIALRDKGDHAASAADFELANRIKTTRLPNDGLSRSGE
jgi:curved DNA-binding protein CbpA/Tfp pilus assembly protein PilF